MSKQNLNSNQKGEPTQKVVRPSHIHIEKNGGQIPTSRNPPPPKPKK